MVLDLRTIYVVCAVACLVLGCVQLLAYATGRFERWPLWWGASNLLLGFGCFGVALRDIAPDFVSVGLANSLTLAGYVALLIAIRVFADERINFLYYGVFVIVGSLPAFLIFDGGASYLPRIAYLSIIFCCCDLAIMREGLRLVRREKLVSGWILVGLFLPTALIFAGRAVLALMGRLDGDSLFDRGGPDQWLALTAAVFICLRGITIVLMASERSRNKLIELAHHDPLTGAMNRSGLADAFGRLEVQPLATAASLSVFLIDIDHFKTLNDTHGHAVGDRILLLFVQAARAQLRAGDIVARQGGDEFVVVLERTAIGDSVHIAERIRAAFRDAVRREAGLDILPTLSIGITEGRAGRDGLETLLQEGDEAVYRAKRDGRDRIEVRPPIPEGAAVAAA
ncbi:diguanylate cyclase (GGDEF)-like protein [Rhizobium sp. BK313]|uniref:GGDEF domain-containing protein n=1 Tax=Rhizobium sp. BK313 TaxID=2587081 RepID=UPI0010622404|nr:GGDEF domain-containing protein [Rhizobium sp. BK313]MBB3457738.1 diguanylate cyclase (GGDEF)-like protein [Rhizobium sp. BK313]